MTTDFSFRDVCRFAEGKNLDLVDDVGKLLSVVLICSPLLTSAPVATVVAGLSLISGTLRIKSELSDIGKRIINKIEQYKGEDSLTRQQRMEAAYYFMVYTAFFEALETLFPELMELVDLSEKEMLGLSEAAFRSLKDNEELPSLIEFTEFELLDETLRLPHPVDSFDVQCEQIPPLYQELTDGFMSFLKCLVVWESADSQEQSRIEKEVKTLPGLSMDFFKAQYYRLAVTIEEFFIWSNLHEHEETQDYLDKLTEHTERQIALAIESREAIDIGFQNMAEVIAALPKYIYKAQTSEILGELTTLYANMIEEPIIKGQFTTERDLPELNFPKKSEIFVPQSFKAIRYTSTLSIW